MWTAGDVYISDKLPQTFSHTIPWPNAKASIELGQIHIHSTYMT